MNQQIAIRFEDLDLATAGVKAQQLREFILDAAPETSVSFVKDDPTTQDFGATLVLVFGTPAAIAVAKGIAAYLSRDRASIEISADGRVVAKGVRGEDAAAIAKAIAEAKH